MGTVDKIVDSLLIMGTEKKNLASQRYNELSGWLRREVEQIKSLIAASPRNSSYVTAQEGASDCGAGRVSSSSTGSSVAQTSSISEASQSQPQRQKRRSPETRMVGVSSGESPEQKRSSYDFEEMAVAAGNVYHNV